MEITFAPDHDAIAAYILSLLLLCCQKVLALNPPKNPMQRLIKTTKDYPLLLFWVITAALYAPAWHSGFVTDAIDWLHDAETLPLVNYLNRSNSAVHALYQTTQLITLGFYKLLGTSRVAWHLLFISMQAVAAHMLYTLCREIFGAANLRNRQQIAFWGAVFFCVSPYLSEVVVWKACFHYLQGLILMLGILICLERYIYTRHQRLPWIAAGLFLVSAFSLEMFYLTPLLAASTLFYYRSLGWQMAAKPRTWAIFLIPQLLIFCLHLGLFHWMYGEWGSHNTGGVFTVPFLDYVAKGLKYIFHIVFFGRYWPQELKEHVYAICEKPACAYIFLSAVFLPFMLFLLRRARKGYSHEQIELLLVFWTLLGIGLALPMPFERLFDLSGNRYLYVPLAFCGMRLAVIGSRLPWRWLKVALAAAWILVSCFLTLRTNRHWQTSERINEQLLTNFPEASGKTTILLSMPYCYKGIPMIKAWPWGNFARMREMLLQHPTPNVYDGMAFNLTAPSNGSIAEVVNDSTVKVTLQQWGTWWWYMDFGGRSYETPDYRIDMRDQGHWYEIILKRPFDQYQLLYQVGDKWQVVKR
jgi:hypothetical protein